MKALPILPEVHIGHHSADSKKAHIIQLLKDINVANAGIADKGETKTKAQNEDANKHEDPAAKANVGDANKQQDINGAGHFLLPELGMLKKTNLLRKELKIRGQIGEGGQKRQIILCQIHASNNRS